MRWYILIRYLKFVNFSYLPTGLSFLGHKLEGTIPRCGRGAAEVWVLDGGLGRCKLIECFMTAYSWSLISIFVESDGLLDAMLSLFVI